MLRALPFAGAPGRSSSNGPSRYLTALARQAVNVLAVLSDALMAHRTYELLRSRGIPHGEALRRAFDIRRDPFAERARPMTK